MTACIGQQRKGLIVKIERRIEDRTVLIHGRADGAVAPRKSFAQKTEGMLLGFPPGAIPSEPPSFVVAEGLPSCDARPPRQNHWPPVKINPLVIAATHMIGTHAPPERQRRPEQPIAQALHLNGKRGGQSHRVAHRSANVPCKRMFRGNCQLRPSANRTAAAAGQIATAVANRVGRHDGIATAPLSLLGMLRRSQNHLLVGRSQHRINDGSATMAVA